VPDRGEALEHTVAVLLPILFPLYARILIIANIGTAVVLFPILRRVNEILALG
jgi:hypothetical protein